MTAAGHGGEGSLFATFGVDALVESIYRALLAAGPQPEDAAGILLRGLGTEPEVRAALGHAREMGLVTDLHGRLQAVGPERAFDALLALEERRIEERRASLARARTAVPELVQEFVERRRNLVGEGVELLDEPHLVRSRLYQLTHEARASVWSLSPGGAIGPAGIAHSLNLERDLAARGVRSRTVLQPPALRSPAMIAHNDELLTLGQEVRVSATDFLRCIVIDGRIGVIPSSEAEMPGAYLLHVPSLVAPLISLFTLVWESAEPYRPAEPGADAVFSEARLRQVARLLAAGHKDETVARRLGVSIRTLRRLVAALLDDLGAGSRFEAGVLAAQRGWLTDDPAD